MGTELSEWIAHPLGEQPKVEEWSAVADTFEQPEESNVVTINALKPGRRVSPPSTRFQKEAELQDRSGRANVFLLTFVCSASQNRKVPKIGAEKRCTLWEVQSGYAS